MALCRQEINDLGERLAQACDQSEINQCLKQLEPAVIRWAQQLLFRKGHGSGDPERLDAFPQEVLSHLYEKRAGFDPNRGTSYEAWCRTVIYHYWVDTIRVGAREAQWPQEADGEDDTGDFGPVVESGSGVTRIVSREELDRWLGEVREAYDDASEAMTATSRDVDFFAVALLLGRFRFARLWEPLDLSKVGAPDQAFWNLIEESFPWHACERSRRIRPKQAPLGEIWTKFTELADAADPGDMARATLLLRQAIGQASGKNEPLEQPTWDQWTRRCKRGVNNQQGLQDVLGDIRYNRVLAPLLESRTVPST